MFCPRCGHENKTGEQYKTGEENKTGQENKAAAGPCAACGLELAPVRKLLAEASPRKAGPRPYRAALGAGGLIALAVVLAILWILFFAVGAVSAEAFLPFLLVLTWIAIAILAVHLAFAWWRRRRGQGELAAA